MQYFRHIVEASRGHLFELREEDSGIQQRPGTLQWLVELVRCVTDSLNKERTSERSQDVFVWVWFNWLVMCAIDYIHQTHTHQNSTHRLEQHGKRIQ